MIIQRLFSAQAKLNKQLKNKLIESIGGRNPFVIPKADVNNSINVKGLLGNNSVASKKRLLGIGKKEKGEIYDHGPKYNRVLSNHDIMKSNAIKAGKK